MLESRTLLSPALALYGIFHAHAHSSTEDHASIPTSLSLTCQEHMARVIFEDLHLVDVVVFSFDPATRTPLWIITELMQHSVYSILHEMRLELTLAEIVDVAIGVVGGLQVRGLWAPCPLRFLSWSCAGVY